jgi:uncharacterized RDD family membrane protein YckC
VVSAVAPDHRLHSRRPSDLRTRMTDQYRSRRPETVPAYPQPLFMEPPASPDYSAQTAHLLSPPSDYASWDKRVRARLIDQFPTYLGLIICCASYLILIVQLARSDSTFQFEGAAAVAMIIGLGVLLAGMGWTAYNRWIIAGRTGQSLGKRATKIRLIGEETNAPIGATNAFIRDLVHILDALTLVGYLWPLWHDSKQTFADQVMRTVVVNETIDPPGS